MARMLWPRRRTNLAHWRKNLTCLCVTVDAWLCWLHSSRCSFQGPLRRPRSLRRPQPAILAAPTSTRIGAVSRSTTSLRKRRFGRCSRHRLERREPEDLRLDLELPGDRGDRQGEHRHVRLHLRPGRDRRYSHGLARQVRDQPRRVVYGSGDTPPPNPCGSADMDNDGVNDGCDNCPSVSNPDQMDSNDNGTGDACEPQPTCAEAHAGEADSDQDGVVDACDNCPTVMNPGQEDSDHNGTGDACEPRHRTTTTVTTDSSRSPEPRTAAPHRPPATRLPLRSPVLRQCSVSASQRQPRACRRRAAAVPPVRSTPAFADRRSHVSCSVSTASES